MSHILEGPASRHQPWGPAKLTQMLGVPLPAHIWSIRDSHELQGPAEQTAAQGMLNVYAPMGKQTLAFASQDTSHSLDRHVRVLPRQVRHGAAIGLREILRSHSACAGVAAPVVAEPSGQSPSCGTLEPTHLLTHTMLGVLALDAPQMWARAPAA